MVLPNKGLRLIDLSLASLPTPFARLIFLASLRDSYTGHYLHEGWVTLASPQEVNQALRQSHLDIFDTVIGLPLLDLCKELREHFRSLGQIGDEAAKLWLEIEPYREMIPAGYTPVGRCLFISQMRAALETLARAPHWEVLEGPIASPRQQPVPPSPPCPYN